MDNAGEIENREGFVWQRDRLVMDLGKMAMDLCGWILNAMEKYREMEKNVQWKNRMEWNGVLWTFMQWIWWGEWTVTIACVIIMVISLN
mmetsp:Transcript_824/g.1275  ORF Transcript_824/g.1275 Transcript_824/m.1275 type:complete len:89 (-) Transcript_824:29-295(-)